MCGWSHVTLTAPLLATSLLLHEIGALRPTLAYLVMRHSSKVSLRLHTADRAAAATHTAAHSAAAHCLCSLLFPACAHCNPCLCSLRSCSLLLQDLAEYVEYKRYIR